MGRTFNAQIRQQGGRSIAVENGIEIYKKTLALSEKQRKDSRNKLANYLRAKRLSLKKRVHETILSTTQKLELHFAQRYRQDMEQELKSLESECLELAFQMAEQILQHELTQSAESIVTKIKSALADIHQSERISITVHDADAPQVKREVPAYCEVLSSSKIDRGDAHIQTRNGTIALDWKLELEQKKKSLSQNLFALQEEDHQ